MGRPPKKDLPPELRRWLQNIGANLSALREASDMTQAQLSKRSKVSITTINEIESRRFRDIRMSTLVALSEGLKVPLLQLIKGTDIKLKVNDQTRLLKASEDILRIAKKISDHDT